MIKSISFSQDEILDSIITLHTGPIQCDTTYGLGNFYRGIRSKAAPKFCFDLEPRVPGVIAADVCHLPLKTCSVRSVMFDPPFMMRTGPGPKLKERFGQKVGTMRDMWNFYFNALHEIHRVLAPTGWLVFKCQDGVLSGKNYFTHIVVCEYAINLGFKAVDLFILLAKHRMTDPTHKRQVHARKFHSYFWVFKKR